MKEKTLKASMTIEMSFLVPFILLVFIGLVLTVFYYHDKNIISGAAYETAVIGSSKVREQEDITDADLNSFCRERLWGKCIFLTSQDVHTYIQEEEIMVEIFAKRNKFSVAVMKKAAITEPERKIRNIRRFEIKDGAKNND